MRLIKKWDFFVIYPNLFEKNYSDGNIRIMNLINLYFVILITFH